ncbi:MAG: ABC transporter ATP-binding protein/permease, partial [Clostridia bacterium]|nr:ABC transporter ATP-binding protein/permease [Clostridia bacterium]
MLESVGKIINWTDKYKGRMYMGFLLTFFISISVSASIIIAAYSVYRVLLDIRGEAALPSYFALWMFIAVAASVGFRFLFTHLRMATLESISYEKTADERIEIGNVLKRVPLGYFEQKKTGDITAVITTQLTLLENLGIGMINKMISGYITTGAIVLYLIIFKIEAALISIAGILLSALAIKWLYNESNRTWPIVHKAQEDMSSGTIEYIRGLSEVKSYGNESKALDIIKSAFSDSKNINIAVEKKYSPIASLHHFAIKTATCGLIFLVSLFTIEGDLSLFYSLMLLMFVFTMFSGVESVKDAAHGLGMIESNIKNLNSIKEAEFIDADGKDVNIDKFDIEFEN